jgi:hypothetical protein
MCVGKINSGANTKNLRRLKLYILKAKLSSTQKRKVKTDKSQAEIYFSFHF